MGAAMSDTYIIEVSSQAAGIVVRNPDGYRFFAATHRFNPLEGQLFRNAPEAERAARRLMIGGVALVAEAPTRFRHCDPVARNGGRLSRSPLLLSELPP